MEQLGENWVSIAVIDHKNIPTTTSLTIAQVFDKEHKDVIKALENLLKSEEFDRRNFAPITYTDESNRKQKMYLLDETLTTVLIMGFTGKEALKWKIKYARQFQDMRARLDLRTHEERVISLHIASSPRKWERTFPPEFYKHLCRLRNIRFDENVHILPAVIGQDTANIVYQRLAPHIYDHLHKTTPRFPCGKLKHTYHQMLTEDYGKKELVYRDDSASKVL